MHSTPTVARSVLVAAVQTEGFALPRLRAFARVPEHLGIAPLRGGVVVYDPDILHREEIQIGAFYVRESQRPASNMSWESWMRLERANDSTNAGPRSPLQTKREVVQLMLTRHELAALTERLLEALDEIDGDPDVEEDDPCGQMDEDGCNTGDCSIYAHGQALQGAGCSIGDPGGCDHGVLKPEYRY